MRHQRHAVYRITFCAPVGSSDLDSKAVLLEKPDTEYRSGIRVFVILTKWFLLTRLETRTKESNIYASIWVRKTLMRNESEGGLVSLR